MAKPFKLEEAPLPKVVFAGIPSIDLRDILSKLEDSAGDDYLCHEVGNHHFEHCVTKAFEDAPGIGSWGVLAWVGREARRRDGSDAYGEDGYFHRHDLLEQAFVEYGPDEGGYWSTEVLTKYRLRWIEQMVGNITAILEERRKEAA